VSSGPQGIKLSDIKNKPLGGIHEAENKKNQVRHLLHTQHIHQRVKKNVHQTPTKNEAKQKRRNPNPNRRIAPHTQHTHPETRRTPPQTHKKIHGIHSHGNNPHKNK